MSLLSQQSLRQKLGAIREDVHPITLLFAGICMQAFLVLLLPKPFVILPAALWLAYRGALAALVTLGLVQNPYIKGVYMGPSQATIPNKDGSIPENNTSPESGSESGVVCFLVGWSINHPAGEFAPGATATSGYFSSAWADAESNREKWGFLGRTPPLIGRSDNGGKHIVTISYWKDLEHLAAFSRGPFHLAGLQYVRKTKGGYPHVGLMHETYVVPKGHWENLYNNSQPIALGQTKHLVESPTGGSSYTSSIVKAKPGGTGFKRLLSSTSSKA